MTETQKVEALESLLSRVILYLELTAHDINDVHVADEVVQQSDAFHDEMLTILHSNSAASN